MANLKVCDACGKDAREFPQLVLGEALNVLLPAIQTQEINGRKIDLCPECVTKPFAEVKRIAEVVFPRTATEAVLNAELFEKHQEEVKRQRDREKWATPTIANTIPEYLR